MTSIYPILNIKIKNICYVSSESKVPNLFWPNCIFYRLETEWKLFDNILKHHCFYCVSAKSTLFWTTVKGCWNLEISINLFQILKSAGKLFRWWRIILLWFGKWLFGCWGIQCCFCRSRRCCLEGEFCQNRWNRVGS